MPVPTALLTAAARSGSDTSRPASQRTNCTSSTISAAPIDDGPAEAVDGAAPVGRQHDADRGGHRGADDGDEEDGGGDVLPLPEAVLVEPVGDVGQAVGQSSARLGDPGSALPGSCKRAGDDGDRVRQVEPGPVGLPFEQRLVGALARRSGRSTGRCRC